MIGRGAGGEYRADRVRDFDAFLPVAAYQSLDEFMFQQVLVIEAAGMHDHVKIDAGVAEGMKPDDRQSLDVVIYFL